MPGSAYILHSRPYRETSALLDLFTPQGRMRAVLRGARSKKGSLARPFIRLDIELKGHAELKTLSRLEASGVFHLLQGQPLFCALYMNELLMRVLPLLDAQPLLFEHYDLTLCALAAGRPVEPLLRTFEWRLLEQLGYGFSLERDIQGQPIATGCWYALQADAGFVPQGGIVPGGFAGDDLQALAAGDWQQPQVLRTAKRLMRQALAPHLGERPLLSRELFLTHTQTKEFNS